MVVGARSGTMRRSSPDHVEAVVDPIVIGVVVAVVLVAVIGFVVVRSRSGPPVDLDAPPRSPDSAPTVTVPSRGLRERLGKTRRALSDRLGAVFRRTALDDAFWSDLEESLVAADLGVAVSTRVVDEVRTSSPADAEDARAELQRRLVTLLDGRDRDLARSGSPSVMLVVGVNGTGKTTSIAKLTSYLKANGHDVVLGGADTFRAAAGEQLRSWGNRVGVDVVGGQQGADPASVAYDAYHAAKARQFDTVIVDTAGRLHSKSNLMDELSKVGRVLRREAGDIDEVLLVIDGTTGQNAIEQARTFTDAVGVTGIVITKLDGTARGGMAIAVEEELDVPVKFIGVGEGMDDLIPFEPADFVDALLGT
jgi:fused signal recognition particle receptor